MASWTCTTASTTARSSPATPSTSMPARRTPIVCAGKQAGRCAHCDHASAPAGTARDAAACERAARIAGRCGSHILIGRAVSSGGPALSAPSKFSACHWSAQTRSFQPSPYWLGDSRNSRLRARIRRSAGASIMPADRLFTCNCCAIKQWQTYDPCENAILRWKQKRSSRLKLWTPPSELNEVVLPQTVVGPLTRAAIFLVLCIRQDEDAVRASARLLCGSLRADSRGGVSRHRGGPYLRRRIRVRCLGQALRSASSCRASSVSGDSLRRTPCRLHAGRHSLPHSRQTHGPVLRTGHADHGRASATWSPSPTRCMAFAISTTAM